MEELLDELASPNSPSSPWSSSRLRRVPRRGHRILRRGGRAELARARGAGLGVVGLVFAVITQFIVSPVARRLVAWIGIPIATLRVFGWLDEVTTRTYGASAPSIQKC
jgi:hypothetical protein